MEIQDRVRLNLDIERTDMQALQEIAEERGTSVAGLVRETLKRLIKRRSK